MVASTFGELEERILDLLWSAERPMAVREVLAGIDRRPPLAYTTVMTVLDRLHGKGMVQREKEGRAYLYFPSLSKSEWLGNQAAQILVGHDGRSSDALLMAFLDSAEQADPAVVARLTALLAARTEKER